MNKPYIKYTTYDTGDWAIIDVNTGEDFHFEGHSIPDHEWIRLIEILGYKVEQEEIEYKEEKWYFPDEKIPEIGSRIIVKDWNGEEMEVELMSLPTDINESNVMMWRYVDD